MGKLLDDEWRELTHPDHLLSAEDAYSLAHIVFYSTAFGTRPEGLTDAQRHFLESRLAAIVDQFLAEGNLDLVAELVFLSRQHPFLDAPEQGWKALVGAQCHDGMVLRRMYLPRRQIDVVNSNRGRFLKNYHATAVAIAACVSGDGRASSTNES